MKHSLGNLGRTARVYVLGTIAIGVAVCAHSVWDLIRNPVGTDWLILLGLTIASGWATLRIPAMPISFSISDTFNIAAALLFGPAAGAISAALDGLVLSARMETSSRSIDRVLFNMAAVTIALWVAAQLFFATGANQSPLDGPLPALRLLIALLMFGAIDFGLNSGIVAVAVGFERGARILDIWRAHLSGVWLTYFGAVFAAMILMLLARFSSMAALVLIVPLPVILYMTFRHALGRATDQIDHLAKVNRVYVGAIEALAHAVDAKDEVTHDHTRRVQDRAVQLARALGVEDEGEIQAIKAASLLHDVGKLAVPEHILNKPGRLTPAEYEIMKRHAPIGADILSVIGFPFAVAPIVRHHHENWDGSGYPAGLSGDAIPIGSRILAVVDCYDALVSDRPYRPRMSEGEALQIVTDRRGTMYDPRVVDMFLELHGAAVMPSPLPAAASDRLSAVQAPLRRGVDHPELQLQAFFEFGHALGRPNSMAELGELVWTHFRTRLPVSAMVLYRYDRDDDSIVAVHQAGALNGVQATARIPLGERLSGWVAATGQMAINSDARLDFDEAARDQSPLRCAVSVPVASSDRSTGVLTFYASEVNAFDDSHRGIAAAAAAAIAPTMAEIAARGVRYGSSPSQNRTHAVRT